MTTFKNPLDWNNRVAKWSALILIYALFITTCFICSKFTIRSLGEFGSNTPHVVALALFLCFFACSKRTFWFLVFPLSLLVMLYSPVGFVYGQPNFQALISLFATNLDESFEFLTMIPSKYWLRVPLVPILALFIYYLSRTFNINPWRNKTAVLVSIATLIVIVKPTTFIDNLKGAVSDVAKEQEALSQVVDHSSWKGSKSVDEQKDYILIIGESARKDYFNIYGYPIANTPFLSTAHATIVDGLTAGGLYTVGSLRNMLTLPNKSDWTPNYDLNLIDLANDAGISTVWLSNQGYIGRWDTPISAIANRAKDVYFFNKHDFAVTNISDFELLKLLPSRLNTDVKGKRLIVLHTIGSHPNVCNRIYDVKNPYKVKDPNLEYVGCYVSSIKKTDAFISRVHGMMKDHENKTGRKFLILYFADHGLHHVSKKNGYVQMTNNSASKFGYDVPLIKIDSDAQQRVTLKSDKSALSFLEGLANWMGISNDRLTHYDLFDGASDSNDYGLKGMIKAIPYGPDPAMDIRNVLK